jgi:hypothetical protein
VRRGFTRDEASALTGPSQGRVNLIGAAGERRLPFCSGLIKSGQRLRGVPAHQTGLLEFSRSARKEKDGVVVGAAAARARRPRSRRRLHSRKGTGTRRLSHLLPRLNRLPSLN